MRLILPATLLALVGCSEPESEPACCAVEPKAKCESALHGLGASEAEKAALLGPRPVCPSDVISIDRMRELDTQWPQACRAAGISAPDIDAGRC